MKWNFSENISDNTDDFDSLSPFIIKQIVEKLSSDYLYDEHDLNKNLSISDQKITSAVNYIKSQIVFENRSIDLKQVEYDGNKYSASGQHQINPSEPIFDLTSAEIRSFISDGDIITADIKSSLSTAACPQCNGHGKFDCGTCNSVGSYTCTDCSGNGEVRCSECKGGLVKCSRCHGTLYHSCHMFGWEHKAKGCPDCHGTNERRCEDCTNGVQTCSNCDGRVIIECSTCDGGGIETCYKCGGNGNLNCEHCNTVGYFTYCLYVDYDLQKFEFVMPLNKDFEDYIDVGISQTQSSLDKKYHDLALSQAEQLSDVSPKDSIGDTMKSIPNHKYGMGNKIPQSTPRVIYSETQEGEGVKLSLNVNFFGKPYLANVDNHGIQIDDSIMTTLNKNAVLEAKKSIPKRMAISFLIIGLVWKFIVIERIGATEAKEYLYHVVGLILFIWGIIIAIGVSKIKKHNTPKLSNQKLSSHGGTATKTKPLNVEDTDENINDEKQQVASPNKPSSNILRIMFKVINWLLGVFFLLYSLAILNSYIQEPLNTKHGVLYGAIMIFILSIIYIPYSNQLICRFTSLKFGWKLKGLSFIFLVSLFAILLDK